MLLRDGNILRRVMILTITALSAIVCVTVHAEDSIPADSVKHGNLISRVIQYFDDSNKPKEYKRFDFSVIGGPHYSSETKLSIGIVAAGLYRMDRTDSITQPSNVSIYGDVSTTGFYLIGIRGDNIFPNDKYRIDYNVYLYSFPTKFWGIGYKNDINDSNKSNYDDFRVETNGNFLIKVANSLYIGPGYEFKYIRAKNVENELLWEGKPLATTTVGLGFKAQYDTRDNLTAPTSGWYIGVEQRFCPRFLGNKSAFSSTEFHANYYHGVWRGGVLATRLHSRYSYGNVPWGLLSTLGGSSTMRGYYEGRYCDKGSLDVTVELRQHVWRRSGLVVWAGAGYVFPDFSEVMICRTLPNFGIGYRWELKKSVNIRLDYGIGRGESGIVFNVNEAF